MRTPWSNLLKYGETAATIIVVSLSIVCILILIAAGVLISKIIDYTS